MLNGRALWWLAGKQLRPQYSADFRGSVGCLKKWTSSVSSQGRSPCSSELTHNIGIVAHIDAGKTTTTERMLFYAGLTSRVGNVDSGSTVTDYLPPERERGITISSAAITLAWAGRTVNLIDTPGHADFTFEVERSLRVLDGAVALLDGSSGVEAQTLAVWRQAKRYHIPCIAFINKMDNPRASVHKAVQSMKTYLGVQPLLTQLPVGKGQEFRGVVDLVQSYAQVWPAGSEGISFSHVPIVELPQEIQEDALHHQSQLLEQVAMLDDTLAATLLENDQDIMTFDPNDLMAGIRRACVSGSGVPVLCGSALRGVAIQPLMDAVTAYLPPASEAAQRIPALAHGLCAYAFKQVYDTHRGLLVYLRIYTGTLLPRTTIYNASRNLREKPTQVLLAQADELEEVGGAYEGSIAVAVGLKHTWTGDTLVQSAAIARAMEEEGTLLTPPTVPPPVFFCTVEPSSAANQRSLDHALQCLSREDPSLRVTVDRDSGQTVLSGMGELHLEIVEERLRRVYRVLCELGPLQVAYREGIALEVEATTSSKQTLATTNYSVVATVKLTPEGTGKGIDVIFDPKVEVRSEEKVAFKGTLETSLAHGPLLGFPMQGVSVNVVRLSRSEGTPLPLLCSCLAQAVHKALQGAEVKLLEPFTELEVTVPDHYIGAVLSDLTSLRRAQVKGVSAHESEGQSVVTTLVPLASLLGYAGGLRSLTSGTGTFSMTFSGHYQVDQHHQNAIVQELRGY